jgi:hypothetical protein
MDINEAIVLGDTEKLKELEANYKGLENPIFSWKFRDEFANFEEMKSKYPELSESLLQSVGEGEWQNRELYVYYSFEDFAKYDIYNGWFSSLQVVCARYDSVSQNPMNPFNYIDLRRFGKAVFERIHKSYVWTDGNRIVYTKFKW